MIGRPTDLGGFLCRKWPPKTRSMWSLCHLPEKRRKEGGNWDSLTQFLSVVMFLQISLCPQLNSSHCSTTGRLCPNECALQWNLKIPDHKLTTCPFQWGKWGVKMEESDVGELRSNMKLSYTIIQPFCSLSTTYIIEELHFLPSVKLSFS